MTQAEAQPKEAEPVENADNATAPPPEKPESNVIPESTFLKEKAKWKEKVAKASEQSEQAAARLRALEIENELLRKNNAPKASGPPDPLDYDDTAEYRRDLDAYIADQAKKQIEQFSQSQAEKVKSEKLAQQLEGAMEKHYQRAASLGDQNFGAIENIAREHLGDEACHQIMMRFDNSEQVLYALGSNPEKAQEFARDLRSDPVGGVIRLTRYAQDLGNVKPESIPEPDSKIEGSAASPSVNWDQKIESLRKEARAGKASMQDVINLKNEARKAGWKE